MNTEKIELPFEVRGRGITKTLYAAFYDVGMATRWRDQQFTEYVDVVRVTEECPEPYIKRTVVA